MPIKIINILGYIMLVIIVVKIIQIRIAGANLTEFQIFVNYWESWLSLMIACIGSVAAITAKDI